MTFNDTITVQPPTTDELDTESLLVNFSDQVNVSTINMQQVLEFLPVWVPHDVPSLVSAWNTASSMGLAKLRTVQTSVGHTIKQFYNDFKVMEWISMEGLCFVTFLVVILSCMLVISINVYRKIRYAIPAGVNCWFCNTNTKVLYSLKDTWTCPNCQQYNGFTSDGHYNKRIPAQFIEALNRPVRGVPAPGYEFDKSSMDSNGLCSQCNLNQVLKVFQLASFVPVNEKNFSAEIEAEQKRLEQLYGICGECQVILENKLKLSPLLSDKQQCMAGKSQVKINKVSPTPTVPTKTRSTNKYIDSDLSLLHNDSLRECSETSESSGDSFLSLDNLKIESRRKKKLEHFQTRSSYLSKPTSPRSMSPSTSICHSQLNYNRQSSMFPSRSYIPFNQNTTPLWKDYPMVQGGLSQTYSLVDTMSCPPGRPAYVSFNSTSPSPTQFSYQSSNLGGVFGGRKPLISPPKFSNNSTPLYSPFIRYGPYYDVSVSSTPLTNGPSPSPNPAMFTSQCFANPISRSSSQSSGFVSQHGGGPQSPQM